MRDFLVLVVPLAFLLLLLEHGCFLGVVHPRHFFFEVELLLDLVLEEFFVSLFIVVLEIGGGGADQLLQVFGREALGVKVVEVSGGRLHDRSLVDWLPLVHVRLHLQQFSDAIDFFSLQDVELVAHMLRYVVQLFRESRDFHFVQINVLHFLAESRVLIKRLYHFLQIAVIEESSNQMLESKILSLSIRIRFNIESNLYMIKKILKKI
jgi:hypothetical protein